MYIIPLPTIFTQTAHPFEIFYHFGSLYPGHSTPDLDAQCITIKLLVLNDISGRRARPRGIIHQALDTYISDMAELMQ